MPIFSNKDTPKKCSRVKNPCKICFETVTEKTGLRCKGACKKWAHFKCLNYTPGKIQDIKDGYLKVNCPCPNCDTTRKEIQIKNLPKYCGKAQCPATKKPVCEVAKCPTKRPIPSGHRKKRCPEDCSSNESVASTPEGSVQVLELSPKQSPPETKQSIHTPVRERSLHKQTSLPRVPSPPKQQPLPGKPSPPYQEPLKQPPPPLTEQSSQGQMLYPPETPPDTHPKIPYRPSPPRQLSPPRRLSPPRQQLTKRPYLYRKLTPPRRNSSPFLICCKDFNQQHTVKAVETTNRECQAGLTNDQCPRKMNHSPASLSDQPNQENANSTQSPLPKDDKGVSTSCAIGLPSMTVLCPGSNVSNMAYKPKLKDATQKENRREQPLNTVKAAKELQCATPANCLSKDPTTELYFEFGQNMPSVTSKNNDASAVVTLDRENISSCQGSVVPCSNLKGPELLKCMPSGTKSVFSMQVDGKMLEVQHMKASKSDSHVALSFDTRKKVIHAMEQMYDSMGQFQNQFRDLLHKMMCVLDHTQAKKRRQMST